MITNGNIPKTMQAVVCYAPEDYRLEERPVPTPGPGEVLAACELSRDLRQRSEVLSGRGALLGRRQNPGYAQPPVIAGHEFAGQVVALGEGADVKYRLALGDYAVSEQIVPCWNCRYCNRGQYWMCPNGDVYGFRQRAFGAMADYILLPIGAVNYRVPETVHPDHAAFIEPLACSIHAVQRGEIQLDDVVVIAGAGPLGLGMIAAARLKPPPLIALDLNDQRLELARACGADLTLNPAQVDAVAEVLALTEGYGCEVYIEATGSPKAVEQGLAMIARLGTFVEFSVMREPSPPTGPSSAT